LIRPHSSLHSLVSLSHKNGKKKSVLVQKFEIVALDEILRNVGEPQQDVEAVVLPLVVSAGVGVDVSVVELVSMP
jgi:hypothetical protein